MPPNLRHASRIDRELHVLEHEVVVLRVEVDPLGRFRPPVGDPDRRGLVAQEHRRGDAGRVGEIRPRRVQRGLREQHRGSGGEVQRRHAALDQALVRRPLRWNAGRARAATEALAARQHAQGAVAIVDVLQRAPHVDRREARFVDQRRVLMHPQTAVRVGQLDEEAGVEDLEGVEQARERGRAGRRDLGADRAPVVHVVVERRGIEAGRVAGNRARAYVRLGMMPEVDLAEALDLIRVEKRHNHEAIPIELGRRRHVAKDRGRGGRHERTGSTCASRSASVIGR